MTERANKTVWFSLSARPAADRVGEYEATRPNGRGHPRIERIYWNGRRWCELADRRVALDLEAYRRWRGLKQPSRDELMQ